MDVSNLLLASGVTILAFIVSIWALSLWKRDASLIDIGWGPGFVLVAWVAASLGEGGARGALVLGLVTLWGLRLGGYLLWRAWGEAEDPRYQAMRRHWGDRFPLMSLLTVYALQAGVMWVVSLPLVVSQLPGGAPLAAFDAVAAGFVVIGLLFESIGDWQLARFRSDPANRGRVLESGLWRTTRHPNYFGDCVVHWGLFAMALGAPYGWITVVGPALMTFMLLRVSGVALLERSIGKRRPDYAGYRQRTSGFLPRWTRPVTHREVTHREVTHREVTHREGEGDPK
jgi:steroid 5-alpha reductase family enzyme